MLSLAERAATAFKSFAALEAALHAKRLASVKISEPIFICSLSRSGSTPLSHLLNQSSEIGSFTYRDLPFLHAIMLWSKLSPFFYGAARSEPRWHGDGLEISHDSPDAFEEIIWRHYLFASRNEAECRALPNDFRDDQFSHTHQNFVRKVLLVRNASRYLAKNNNNLLRLPFISRMYPDAKIVVLMRNPADHVASLARVHRLFRERSLSEPRLGTYLQKLGHFEFGPQRLPLNFGDEASVAATLAHWERGEEEAGYLEQWLQAYRFTQSLRLPNIRFVRIEDLANEPSEIEALYAFLNLKLELSVLKNAPLKINRASHPGPPLAKLKEALDLYDSVGSRRSAS